MAVNETKILGHLSLASVAANPTAPPDGMANAYCKGNVFVFQYNDGGTVRYHTYNMEQTILPVWLSSTTPP